MSDQRKLQSTPDQRIVLDKQNRRHPAEYPGPVALAIGNRVIGVDSSPAMLEQAREEYVFVARTGR